MRPFVWLGLLLAGAGAVRLVTAEWALAGACCLAGAFLARSRRSRTHRGAATSAPRPGRAAQPADASHRASRLGSARPLWVCASLAIAGLQCARGAQERSPIWQSAPFGVVAPFAKSKAASEDWSLWALGPERIPVLCPTGIAQAGDQVQIHPGARLDRLAALPGVEAEPHRWVCDPGQVLRTQAARTPAWRIATARWLTTLRAEAAQRLARLEGEQSTGLARALLLGMSGEVPSEWKERFTRTGTRHLLALSGLHVGLIWWMVLHPFTRVLARGFPLRRRRVLQGGCTLLGLLALAPFLGSGTPALRACLAYGIAALSRCLPAGPGQPNGAGRRGDGLSLWAFALVLELLHDPSAFASVSLQMSYGATLALILCVPGPAGFGLRTDPDPPGFGFESDSLGRARSGVFVALLPAVAHWVRTGWRASWVATLATLPILWFHFGEWSPIGPLGTLLLLPLVMLAIAAGVLALLLPMAMPKAVGSWPFERMGDVLLWLDRWPGTPWGLPERPAALLIGALLSTLFWRWGRALGFAWRARAEWLRVALAAWALVLMPWVRPPRVAECHVADVGHGTAILLRFPCGRNVFFDGGSRDRKGVARRVFHPWLRRFEIRRATIVLSHDHRDHASALPFLAERLHVDAWLGAWPSSIARAWQEPWQHQDLASGIAAGPACAFGQCHLEIWRGLAASGNEGSRNLWAEWAGQHLFLCGDAEARGVEPLLPALAQRPGLQALLVPHHGSEQPHWARLLRVTRPKELWFSASPLSPLARRHRALSRSAGAKAPRVRWTAQNGGWRMTFTKPTPVESGIRVNLKPPSRYDP